MKVNVRYGEQKVIAQAKDYEGNDVTMIESSARGFIGDRNDCENYTKRTVYLVTVEYVFDMVTTFIYLDKATAFNMFRKFLVK